MRRQKSHQQASSLVASERQDLPEEEREETTDAKTKSERIDELLPSMQREALILIFPDPSFLVGNSNGPCAPASFPSLEPQREGEKAHGPGEKHSGKACETLLFTRIPQLPGG